MKSKINVSPAAFQGVVGRWAVQCFGHKTATNIPERNHRFAEEALELVQASGCSKEEAIMLVEYVFSRPIGEIKQEVGGVMTTLAALCFARDIDMLQCGADELERIIQPEVMEKIKAKHANKPPSSPLPGSAE